MIVIYAFSSCVYFDGPRGSVLYGERQSEDGRTRKSAALMKQKLLKGIVLLLLTYTGAELAFPEFCREGSLSVVVAQGAETASRGDSVDAVVLDVESSAPGIPNEDRQKPNDEDCFCCCAHVMPSPLFVDPVVAEQVSLAYTPAAVSIPTGSLHAPYHPPRFA